jgi:hypothetical protein
MRSASDVGTTTFLRRLLLRPPAVKKVLIKWLEQEEVELLRLINATRGKREGGGEEKKSGDRESE